MIARTLALVALLASIPASAKYFSEADAGYSWAAAGGQQARIDIDGDPVTLEDLDRDCIDDRLEHAVAKAFRPIYIFDSRESARRPDEPMMIYAVRAADPKACARGLPVLRLRIVYAALYERDGGYGPTSWCGDSHLGDNEGMTVIAELSADHLVARALEYDAGHAANWPRMRMWMWGGTHPAIFLAAGKHHSYASNHTDGRDSAYSDWGCNDDIDGRGTVVFPSLDDPRAPRGRKNVGEPHAHDPAAFVNDLAVFGYPGENAWSRKPFCGGKAALCPTTSSLRGMW